MTIWDNDHIYNEISKHRTWFAECHNAQKERILALNTTLSRVEAKLDVLLADNGYTPSGYTEEGKVIFLKRLEPATLIGETVELGSKES